jgi:2OG-Fe(II) oxygenase superfamily
MAMQNINFSELDFYPIAQMDGSLPQGGFVPETPIWTVKSATLLRPLAHRTATSMRHDIELGNKLAFIIDNVLDDEEADAIVALTEKFGYRPEAPGISTPPGMRQNKTVHWVSDETMLGPILERIKAHLPETVEGSRLSNRLSHRINMYRYDKNDVFNPHTDGDWPGFGLSTDGKSMVHWQRVHSKLTMLLYLNGHKDGIKGGETHLYERGNIMVSVAPQKGRALFFRHGRDRSSVLHSGAQVTGSISKYVARINVLYEL